MNLSQITSIGWCANTALDSGASAPFSFQEISDAADNGTLVDLLMKIDQGGIIQLWAREPNTKQEIERALADAASAICGRERRKAGVEKNPLCLVMALVLETIQQQFRK